MIGARRGRPGDVAGRLARAEQLAADDSVVAAPLALLVSVLHHSATRADSDLIRSEAALLAASVEPNGAAGRFPLLDLDVAAGPVMAELDVGVEALVGLGGTVPAPLSEAGQEAARWSGPDRRQLVETWLDDPCLVEPRLAFWVRVAAAPLLETAAIGVAVPAPEEWRGGACPVCGGQAQVSVIAEETGEFLGGSPRSLVCGRCATWWPFPRAVCPLCGEEDPRNLACFFDGQRRCVRVDACETCRGYVKTFDLREKGAPEIVPLVDDLATLTLDLWAGEQGYARPLPSFAGV